LNVSNLEDVAYLDESGCNMHTIKNRGYSVKGERLYGDRYSGQGKRISNIQVITSNGIKASCLFEGTLNTEIYLNYIEKSLISSIKGLFKILIMDNLKIHKNPKALELFQKAGIQVIFQPSYSPEFNPIENIFSKQKNHIKKTPKHSVEDCKKAWIESIKIITLDDIKNSINHAKNIWQSFLT
jgi:transposase